MIGPQLIELAQVAEQESMNRAMEHQAARRAREEGKDRAKSHRRAFPWHLWDGSPRPASADGAAGDCGGTPCPDPA